MALEAVVFSHFGYGLPWCDLMGTGGGGFGELCTGDDWPANHDLVASVAPGVDDGCWEAVCAMDQSSDASTELGKEASAAEPAAAAVARRKRRRAKVVKNRDEIESQRMTHIAVERNRRRQMNEYLAMLRNLMPPSYAHRGDQASIVGGAINYVRELEQLLQSLQVQKSMKSRLTSATDADAGESPFAGFFTFPQYSTSSSHDAATAGGSSGGSTSTSANNVDGAAGSTTPTDQISICRPTAVADIEVTMAEGHASLKVFARRKPRQLLRLVAGLQQLRVPPLHLNMTTAAGGMVLYTFSLKVEDDSKLGSVEDIADSVHEILRSLQQETAVM